MKVVESGRILFLGTYKHVVDPKKRLTLPSKFLSGLGKEVYISKGFDGCLEIRTENDFNAYVDSLLAFSNTSKDVRQIQRVFLSLSAKIEIDPAKRILLPANLMEKANITKDVIVIGVGKTIEIWDAKTFATYSSSAETKYEDAAERVYMKGENK